MGRPSGRHVLTTLTLLAAVAGGLLATTTTRAAADDAVPGGTHRDTGTQRPVTRTRVGFTRQVTMNVAYAMTRARQRRDIRRTAQKADVIGWQEINRRAQTRAIGNLEGWDTYWPGGLRSDGQVGGYAVNSAPISWRRSRWDFVRGGARLASDEIPGICRDRYLTFVVLLHRESGETILRWNVHFVPNALNKKKVRRKQQRKVAWYQAARTVKDFLDEHGDRGFAAVIGGGDINGRKAFVGDRVSYDTDHRGVDYLTHIPSYRVRAWRPRFIQMNSDHEKVRVAYTLFR